MKTYLFSYWHDYAWWFLEIQAESEVDAKARVDAIQHARFDGELVAEAPTFLGWFARLWVWLKEVPR